MSKKGIKLFASVLSVAQETRIQLLHGDTQDIMLGQLLDTMKDQIKHEFSHLTMMKPKEIKSHDKIRD